MAQTNTNKQQTNERPGGTRINLRIPCPAEDACANTSDAICHYLVLAWSAAIACSDGLPVLGYGVGSKPLGVRLERIQSRQSSFIDSNLCATPRTLKGPRSRRVREGVSRYGSRRPD